jgi:hypothetical protein
MIALIAQLPPLWENIASLVQDIRLSICAARPHNLLLDWFSKSDRLDDVIEGRLGGEPFLRWNDLHYAGLHAVGIDFCHL